MCLLMASITSKSSKSLSFSVILGILLLIGSHIFSVLLASRHLSNMYLIPTETDPMTIRILLNLKILHQYRARLCEMTKNPVTVESTSVTMPPVAQLHMIFLRLMTGFISSQYAVKQHISISNVMITSIASSMERFGGGSGSLLGLTPGR